VSASRTIGRVRPSLAAWYLENCSVNLWPICIEQILMSKHDLKPVLGWTMLSREEMRQVERSLANSDQDTRDEIGFLLIHQGLADRFFPGTSVLHTRVRYALFIPWLYHRAASNPKRGSDLEATIRHLLIELAIRLKQIGGEPQDVIGGDKLGQLTSQPPDRVYWSALRAWGLLLPAVDSRSEALRRLRAAARISAMDDDGVQLDDEAREVFAGLPPPPTDWNDPQQALHFKMPREEREYLRSKLRLLTRPGDNAPSLLARLAEAGDSFHDSSHSLPVQLDARADAADRQALDVARDAASLAAIGRAVYGALVEQLRAKDGVTDDWMFRGLLATHFTRYGAAASRCDLDTMEKLIPDLPPDIKTVLRKTQAYIREGNPGEFTSLQDCYEAAEVRRKTSRRARLLDWEPSAQRRAEWDPQRHNTTPLHFRWKVVRAMLADLSDKA
jgi:hypothetical protein